MINVISFSTGLSSALTVERVYQRFGSESLRIVFMDTLIEDDDNYRFKQDMEKRWLDMGLSIIELKEGRTPYQVAKQEHIIPNQRRAPCTNRLKIEPFMQWLKKQNQELTVHIGFDYSDVDRCEAVKRNYQRYGYQVDFPLLWKPIEWRPYTQICREDWGIEPPRMYKLGYSHANCGGICVKQGWGDWLRSLESFPDRYEAAEIWERNMRKNSINANYAILRDQSNGQVRPKTLEELRIDYQGKKNYQPSLFSDAFVCIQCGI